MAVALALALVALAPRALRRARRLARLVARAPAPALALALALRKQQLSAAAIELPRRQVFSSCPRIHGVFKLLPCGLSANTRFLQATPIIGHKQVSSQESFGDSEPSSDLIA